MRSEASAIALLGGGLAGVFIALFLWWVMPGGASKQPPEKVTNQVINPVQMPSQPQLADGDKARMRELLQQRPEADGKDFDRQVWVADLVNVIGDRTPDPDEVSQIAGLVHRYASRFDLSPELVLAVMAVESNFDRFAVSKSGARGLMQIMPFWKRDIGSADDNLFNIETNIRYGCAILKFYLDRYGKMADALAAYNGSSGNTNYPLKVYDRMRRFKASAGDLRS